MNTRLQTRTIRTETGWTVEALVVDATTGEVLGRAVSLVPSRPEDDEQGSADPADVLESAERETTALAVQRAGAHDRKQD